MAAPELEVLRPALELALEVAVAGATETPPVDPPARLRRVLGFARPDRALPTVRAVLDADATFRRRVADAADEEQLGRVPWVFLVRPEGWEGEVAAATAAAADARQDRAAARAESTAAKRLEAAEAARRRAEAARAAAIAEGARADRALGVERRRRRAAEDELARVRRRAEEYGAALAAEAARTAADQERLRAEIARLRAEVEAVRSRPPVGGAATPEGGAARGGPAWDRGAAERALDAARRSLDDVANALAAPGPSAGPGDETRLAAPHEPSSRLRGDGVGSRSPSARRRPTRLPPALLEDDADVAAHLLRVRRVLVVVDGYNVTKQARPDLAIPDQRRWLADRLAGLAARTGATFEVVFDGGEEGGTPPRTTRANGVEVAFSPAGVEADDVVLARVAATPLDRPVVVVSDDRRVRTGAADRGANVLAVGQLLGAGGR